MGRTRKSLERVIASLGNFDRIIKRECRASAVIIIQEQAFHVYDGMAPGFNDIFLKLFSESLYRVADIIKPGNRESAYASIGEMTHERLVEIHRTMMIPVTYLHHVRSLKKATMASIRLHSCPIHDNSRIMDRKVTLMKNMDTIKKIYSQIRSSDFKNGSIENQAQEMNQSLMKSRNMLGDVERLYGNILD